MNSNRVFYILAGVIVIAIFLVVFLILNNLGGGDGGRPVTLQMWGVFDPNSAFERMISNFQLQNQNIKIIYKQIPYEEYERTLIQALAAGTGPDIAMIHHTWLPKHGNKLKPFPADLKHDKKPVFSFKEFQDQFVDVAVRDLTSQEQIYAMPLYVDTLALYYNKDLLNSAGITRPPQTWEEVNDDVQILTRLDGSGNIIQSGIALGTARNINRSTDILSALMIQSGVRMNDDGGGPTFAERVNSQNIGAIALEYYTDFANPQKQTYSWNDSQHYSIDSFIEGATAMMIGYAHQAQVIRTKAARLNFAIAPMPQASLSSPKQYANYWALAVTNQSANSDAAWRFLVYAGSREGASEYLNQTQRPSARRDLIELQRDDLNMGAFAVQAIAAMSWHQKDNVAIESIFADMIDDVNYKRFTIRDALERAQARAGVIGSQ